MCRRRKTLPSLASFVQCIAAAVCRFHLVVENVSQRLLSDIPRVIGEFTCPIAERRAESVGHGIHLHATQHRSQCHIRESFPAFG